MLDFASSLVQYLRSLMYQVRHNWIYFSVGACALFGMGLLGFYSRAQIIYFLETSRYVSLLGIAGILLVAFLCSNAPRRISARLVVGALGMQATLAFFILRTSIGCSIVHTIASGLTKIGQFSSHGIAFIFGNLGSASGPWGHVFVFHILPMIIFFGALMSLLFHLGIVQALVRFFSFLIRPILGTSGAETLCAIANSMLGQTEAPLLIKHYLGAMTRSEMMVVMVSGFATLSGSLLVIYGASGVPMEHLLAASVMSIPGSLLIAKMLMPEVEVSKTSSGNALNMKPETKNILDAISTGTVDGLKLAANVAAMLVTFISLIALVNYVLHDLFGWYSLSEMFGRLFAPCAQLLGIPSSEALKAGELLGTKLVVNEFVAYDQLTHAHLSPRTQAILTYALCGFSNFSCIGIQIGGIGALAPEKREQLTSLGLIALLGGTLTNFLNAAIAALFLQ